MGEGKRFDQRARDVEKIMHELEWPTDESERVDERPRPEEQNDNEARGDIRPGRDLPMEITARAFSTRK